MAVSLSLWRRLISRRQGRSSRPDLSSLLQALGNTTVASEDPGGGLPPSGNVRIT